MGHSRKGKTNMPKARHQLLQHTFTANGRKAASYFQIHLQTSDSSSIKDDRSAFIQHCCFLSPATSSAFMWVASPPLQLPSKGAQGINTKRWVVTPGSTKLPARWTHSHSLKTESRYSSPLSTAAAIQPANEKWRFNTGCAWTCARDIHRADNKIQDLLRGGFGSWHINPKWIILCGSRWLCMTKLEILEGAVEECWERVRVERKAGL